MPGCPKMGKYMAFWNSGLQKTPRLHQNREEIYSNIYNNIYGLAWGGLLSFPGKELFMRGGIVRQGAHGKIYLLTKKMYKEIFCLYILLPGYPKKGNM